MKNVLSILFFFIKKRTNGSTFYSHIYKVFIYFVKFAKVFFSPNFRTSLSIGRVPVDPQQQKLKISEILQQKCLLGQHMQPPATHSFHLSLTMQPRNNSNDE